MTFHNGLFLPGVALDNYGVVADPAAGANYADISLVGSGARYQIIALSFLFTTSADVADRRVQLLWRFDHTSLSEVDMVMAQAQVVQPASQAVRYLCAPGYADSTTIIDSRCMIRLPFPLELWTPSGAGTGWTMDSDVVNIDNTDQLSDFRFWIREARGAPA